MQLKEKHCSDLIREIYDFRHLETALQTELSEMKSNHESEMLKIERKCAKDILDMKDKSEKAVENYKSKMKKMEKELGGENERLKRKLETESRLLKQAKIMRTFHLQKRGPKSVSGVLVLEHASLFIDV